jgi:hypothetical protein
MPVKPAWLIASSFRGSVSALLLPIEQVAYDRGMLRRDSYVILGADAIMVFLVISVLDMCMLLL